MNDVIKSLNSDLTDSRDSLSKIRSQKIEAASQRFKELGGCTKCRGRGWFVTWDTLDCMDGGYAQYGSCDEPGCTHETRNASGLAPKNNKYDRLNRGSMWDPIYTDDETALIRDLQNKINQLELSIQQEKDRWTPSPDKVVRVVRASGPKKYRPPMGLEGLVIKSVSNDYGTQKLIILDSDGNQHWVKAKHVDVISPEPDTEDWRSAQEAHRQNSGIPVIVTVKRRSSKAALIRTTRGREFWCPISTAPDLRVAKIGSAVSVIIPIWLAKKNQIIS